jgi:hypothetical protein
MGPLREGIDFPSEAERRRTCVLCRGATEALLLLRLTRRAYDQFEALERAGEWA